MFRFLNTQGQLTDWSEEKLCSLPDDLVFLDLLNPTREEELSAEQGLSFGLPTREEMQEIEESSRLYVEKGAIYMTAWLPVGLDTNDPDNSAITFVMTPKNLITVRYADPLTFRILAGLIGRQCTAPITGDEMFLVIMERVVSRIADALQAIEADLKRVSRDIFSDIPKKRENGEPVRDLNDVVKLVGRRSAQVAMLRESLLSIARMMQFFLHNAATWMNGEVANKFRSVMRDVKSLDEYTNQQTNELTFLLDSTLGLINIEQNQIIKIMTVVSVVFMPPTLIAGIYGMNFKHMPELEHPAAYPLTWVAMVMAAILPVLYFKRKKML